MHARQSQCGSGSGSVQGQPAMQVLRHLVHIGQSTTDNGQRRRKCKQAKTCWCINVHNTHSHTNRNISQVGPHLHALGYADLAWHPALIAHGAHSITIATHSKPNRSLPICTLIHHRFMSVFLLLLRSTVVGGYCMRACQFDRNVERDGF